jgi:hypothetical protein
MTIPIDSTNLESYVPVYDVMPDKWEDAKIILVEVLKKITNSLNVKEIGFFLDQELLSGKSFIPGISNGGVSSQQFRTVLRTVIDFGQLPNAGAKTVPHEIVFDENFTLIQMFASATDPTNLVAIPIPYAGAGAADGVALFMNSTDIVIVTQTNRSTYTRCYVVIEYLQEL